MLISIAAIWTFFAYDLVRINQAFKRTSIVLLLVDSEVCFRLLFTVSWRVGFR